MGQPVGFLDVLDPGAWPGCVDRPDLQGPWACGWDGGAEKDQHSRAPTTSGVSVARDTGASGAQPQVGARVLVSTGGALEEVDVGCHHPRPLRRPYVCCKESTGQAGTGQLACGPADGLPASGWAGQCVPGPRAPL